MPAVTEPAPVTRVFGVLRDGVRRHSFVGANFFMSMTDSYAYRPLVWDVYVERVSNPKEGKPADEALIAAALSKARVYFKALHYLMGRQAFLAGEAPTLADFHAAPVFGYFLEAPEGREVVREFPRVQQWWQRISATEAFKRAVGS